MMKYNGNASLKRDIIFTLQRRRPIAADGARRGRFMR